MMRERVYKFDILYGLIMIEKVNMNLVFIYDQMMRERLFINLVFIMG